MQRFLYAIFFLSGASGLIFETVWFRRAGITFGNSVWAGSVVLSSFMAGLALGNGLAGRYGDRLSRPLRFYAVLEVFVGVAGLGVYAALGTLDDSLGPLFRPLLSQPSALNAARLSVAFALFLLPSTAMGATLPVMIKGFPVNDDRFGRVLGGLYGWNTVGAVAGALAGELVLIGRFGVFGTAVAACLGNLLAGGLALMTARALPKSEDEAAVTPGTSTDGGRRWQSARLLAAAFLCGGILLSLEVVWFRTMLVDVMGTSLTFAVMLAVVLAGIGLGGLAASVFAGRTSMTLLLPAVSLASGAFVVLAYAHYVSQPGEARLDVVYDAGTTAWLAIQLMFPVCLTSGILFTLLGAALQQQLGGASRSAGYVTLGNTTGAMVGAFAGGFVWIPSLGIERSFFWLAMLYGVVAVLVIRRTAFESRRGTAVLVLIAGAFAFSLSRFPHGALRERFISTAMARYPMPECSVAAYREGIAETITYLRSDLLGEPFRYKLVTNGHSMAGTGVHSAQYMKMFVYLPVALHPQPRKALLISFGCGVTAKALTDTSELEEIDVVDISRDILELNEVVYPDPEERPLRDSRVRVFAGDGRFYLQTTDRRYDLITGEPPPPSASGVVSLYTEEYFQLIHDRLLPGGMTTYWLPLHDLNEGDARGVIHAFCNVFEESSLWMGSGRDLILLGIRSGGAKVSAERFVRQWRDPVVGPEIRALGFEFPEQLGAYFIADRTWLQSLSAKTPALVDDFPYRLSRVLGATGDSRYPEMIDPVGAAERFRSSGHIRRLWPESIAAASLEFFAFRYQIHDAMTEDVKLAPENRRGLRGLHHLLTESPLSTAVLWMRHSQVREQEILSASPICARGMGFCYHRFGDGALAERNYELAAENYMRARQADPGRIPNYRYLDVYALCMAGRKEDAQNWADQVARLVGPELVDHPDWRFLRTTFGLVDPL